MKKIPPGCIRVFMLFTIFILGHDPSLAQAKIGGNVGAPDATAVLELDGGSTRGLLLPRMRKVDMLGIVNPAEGLTLYITDEQATYLRRQSNWIKLSGAADAFSLPYTGAFGTAGPILSLSQFNNSTGSVAKFSNTDAANDGNVLEVTSNSSSAGANAGFFKLNNTNSTAAAVRAEANVSFANFGAGAFYGINTGTQGRAATFEASNPAGLAGGIGVLVESGGDGINASVVGNGDGIETTSSGNGRALFAWKTVIGTGIAGQFSNQNAGNTAPVLLVTNQGTGNAIQVEGTNPQIQLRQDDVAKGFVQLNGDDLRLGTVAGNDGGRIVFRNQGSDRMTIDSTGKVGIGTSSPLATALLHLRDNTGNGNLIIDANIENGNGTGPGINFVDLNGNILTAVGDILGSSDGLTFFVPATRDFRFDTYSTPTHLFIDGATGNTIIGQDTGPAGGNKLAVKGSIAATAYNVVSLASWPDYVFDKSYKLRSLNETENFINENKHLPGIPPASEIEKNGFEVSDMQKRVLEKVEELTLHLIEANKRIQMLEEKIRLMEKK